MNRIQLKTLFCLFLLLVGCKNVKQDIRPAHDLEFKVASYNIRYEAAADEKSGNGWNIRKEPLAKVILDHRFDIVGTQEGNSKQLNDLKVLVSEFDYVGHPYGGAKANLHNCATFYKRDLFELVDSGVFWLSQTPDTLSIGWDATDTRICSWAKFKEKRTGKEFFFFNAHFYWKNKTARENSGPLLVNKIKEIAKDSPVIVTGDFNSPSSTPQAKAIMTVLKDAYTATESERIGPEGTAFPGGVFEGTPESRIDYIFVSDHFRVLNYTTMDDSYNDGRYPSDHFPISSDVSIRLD